MTAIVPTVAVGQVYAGVTGNRMVVLEVDGADCLLQYRPNPYDEDPIWESCKDVARYFTLVENGSKGPRS